MNYVLGLVSRLTIFVTLIGLASPAHAQIVCDEALTGAKAVPFRQLRVVIEGKARQVTIVTRVNAQAFKDYIHGDSTVEINMDSSKIKVFGQRLRNLLEGPTNMLWNLVLLAKGDKKFAKTYKFENYDETMLSSDQIIEISRMLAKMRAGKWDAINVQIGKITLSGKEFRNLLSEADKRDFVKVSIDHTFGSSWRSKTIRFIYSVNRSFFLTPLFLTLAAPSIFPELKQVQAEALIMSNLGIGTVAALTASVIGSAANLLPRSIPILNKLIYFMPNLGSLGFGVAESSAITLERSRLMAEKLSEVFAQDPDWEQILIVTENERQSLAVQEVLQGQ